MSNTESSPTSQASPGRDILHAVRYHLSGPRGLVIAGAVVIVAGLAFNWSWLVAVGVAPLLLSVLPCVAMCALGLCMNRMTGRSCSTADVSDKAVEGAKTHSADLKGKG
ncbi:hypothetical protein [Mesorhizobium sp. LjRoot246]|uniref:hypothetical protein n=1 Tax=Mesorhizobium sp. LjRoot246 TaxID=3342294 RepID=UPI003ECCE20C